MKCRDFREFIDSYLSDELLTETNHDILRHLEECGECRAEIEARRLVRSRLESAVKNSPEFQIRTRFASQLNSALRDSLRTRKRARFSFSAFGGTWAAAAAALLIVMTLGVIFVGDSNVASTEVASAAYTIPNLPVNHLTNIASGDHEHCAIRHNLKLPPIALSKASASYKGIAGLITKPLRNVLANYTVVESHACIYNGAQFAHVALRKRDKLISVLITDGENPSVAKSLGIKKYASQKYRLARFDVGRKAVFVVSNLDDRTNAWAAEALYAPLKEHFSGSGSASSVQTAMLLMN